MMKQERTGGALKLAAAFALLALCLLAPASARAQWATTGGDINNTNAGAVGVGTNTPGAKLDVGAGAPARGAYTDLLLGRGGNNPQLEFFGPSRRTSARSTLRGSCRLCS